jgi:hypothetical protein
MVKEVSLCTLREYLLEIMINSRQLKGKNIIGKKYNLWNYSGISLMTYKDGGKIIDYLEDDDERRIFDYQTASYRYNYSNTNSILYSTIFILFLISHAKNHQC